MITSRKGEESDHGKIAYITTFRFYLQAKNMTAVIERFVKKYLYDAKPVFQVLR